MTSLLLKLPWFLATPLVAGVAAVFALAGFMFTGDYFHETCKNERNLLTGDFEPSNCGEGAKVARASAGEQVVDGRQATGAATGTTKSVATPTSQAAASSTSAATSTSAASGTPTVPASPTLSPVPTSTATAATTGTNPSSTPTATAPPPTSTPAPTPTAAPTQAPVQPGVVARGTFRDGAPGHTGKGRVEVQRLADGSLNVLLADFSVTNGPDLYVVLSRSSDGSYGGGDLQLQKLKANNGTQNYAVPAGTDISQYGSILIWCRAFNVVFAYAPLGTP